MTPNQLTNHQFKERMIEIIANNFGHVQQSTEVAEEIIKLIKESK